MPNGSQIWLAGLDEKQRVDKILGQEFATIFLDRSIAIEVGSWLNANQSPITQNRDVVCDSIDLFHSVADEHHRYLTRLEAGYDGEEPLDFALGQSLPSQFV